MRNPLKKYILNDPSRIWISKPPNSSRGRGIFLAKNSEDLDRILHSHIEQHPSEKPERLGLIVQEYIKNPLLIGGYKFDLRLYVLVKNFDPLEIYLYKEGLARFCVEKFTLSDFRVVRHLTNTSINHKLWSSGNLPESVEDEFYRVINSCLGPGDFSKRTFSSVLKYLSSLGANTRKIWEDIQRVILLTIMALSSAPLKQHQPVNCFELLGFDILLTDDYKPYLLEVNLGPSLNLSCTTDITIKIPMLDQLIDIVTGADHKDTDYVRIIPPNSLSSPKRRMETEL